MFLVVVTVVVLESSVVGDTVSDDFLDLKIGIFGEALVVVLANHCFVCQCSF